MKRSTIKTCSTMLALSLFGMAGCATQAPEVVSDAEETPSTILLVSLDDGSIIRQTVNLDADICVKSVTESETTCFSQGDAILNPDGMIVGYQMTSETIQLFGSE